MTFKEFAVGMQLREITLEAIDAPNLIRPAAIERFRDALQHFKQRVAPGDRIYYYSSERELWDNLMGSEGYIAVRGEEIVAELMMRMN